MARDFRARPARQRKHWHQLLSSMAQFTAAGTILLDTFTDADRDPFTVMRLIGEVSVGPDETGITAGDSAMIFIGIGVVSTDAAVVGASAMPDPGGEADFPWLWWAPIFVQIPTIADLCASVRHVEISSKAMRKVGPGQSLVAIAEYADLAGTPPLDVVLSARLLVGTS